MQSEQSTEAELRAAWTSSAWLSPLGGSAAAWADEEIQRRLLGGVKRQTETLGSLKAVAPAAIAMTSQGTAHGRFQRAIHRRHVQAAEMAAREMGGLSLADALSLCELLANTDPARYERAALRWLQRFIDERLPPLTEVALAASALAELRHGHRTPGSRP